MGGYAYVIPGHLAPERLERPSDTAVQAHPTFWQRLLGAPKPVDALSAVQLPNGDRLIEIPAVPLDPALIEDLRAWLDERVEQPSRGTAVVLDYLNDSSPTVYVRGIQHATTQTSEHFVQMMFTGCAGMAETSARLMAHWSALWYVAERERIHAEHLVPFGFIPEPGVPVDDERMAFLPAGELGYLEYVPSERRDAGQTAFELDQGVVEAFDGSALLTRLDDLFGGFMREGLCRCQLCDPAFGDASFDEGHVRDGGVPQLSAG